MSWNHRVLKSKDGEDDLFEIVEVYYKKNKPHAYGKPFVMGNTIEELKEVLKQMGRCIEKDFLTEEDFGES